MVYQKQHVDNRDRSKTKRRRSQGTAIAPSNPPAASDAQSTVVHGSALLAALQTRFGVEGFLFYFLGTQNPITVMLGSICGEFVDDQANAPSDWS